MAQVIRERRLLWGEQGFINLWIKRERQRIHEKRAVLARERYGTTTGKLLVSAKIELARLLEGCSPTQETKLVLEALQNYMNGED